MSIWFMNKICLFFILLCCVHSYLLPFSNGLRLHFSLPLVIKITARIDRWQIKRKETCKGRGLKSTNHRTYADLSCFLKVMLHETIRNDDF